MLIRHMPRSTGRHRSSDASRVTLGQAIDRAMKQSDYGRQVALADALGIDQTTLSKIITGKVGVTVERVAEIEDLCGVPRGQILVWSGYVVPAALTPSSDQFALAASAGKAARPPRATRKRPSPRPNE